MFNFFSKQPEKSKPNFLGETHEHKACIVVFDGTKASSQLNRLMDQYQKCTLIRDKTVDRLKAMIKDCEEITLHYHKLQHACLTSLQIADSYEEMIAMKLGLMPASEMQGVAICPGCLQQAMIACEEVLNSLKDIQEATKEYV